MKQDLHEVRPYGDHLGDGRMQVSFTLPVPASPEAKEGARLFLEGMGLSHAEVTWMEPVGEEFTFFVAYGHAANAIDFTKVQVPRPPYPILSREELTLVARKHFRHRIIVVGATTGTDAHTVGLDAILSMKGVAGDKGLESYPFFRVVNLRAQVENRKLVERAVEERAEVVLVSKMVTQQDRHLEDLRELAGLLQDERRLPKKVLKICGGPKIDHAVARGLGFQAGFGPGTRPSEVANFIVHALIGEVHLGEESAEGPSRVEGEDQKTPHAKGRSLLGWLGRGGKDS